MIDDLRQALRRLRRRPAFTATAVLTLSLGVGATTAIFTVVDSVLLEPLPYEEPGELVRVGHHWPAVPEAEIGVTEAAFVVYRDETRALGELGVYSPVGLNLDGAERPVRVRAARASHSLLPLLGTAPAVGRGFGREDDRPGAPLVAVLSHGLRQRLFRGEGDVVGRRVRIDGEPAEIVGVMPRDFRFPEEETELWVPLRLDESRPSVISFYLEAVGRLAGGATPEAAESELDALFSRPFERFPHELLSAEELRESGLRAEVRPLKDALVGEAGDVLWVVLAAVGLIFAVACANVANLFLVQAEGRDTEFAVRSAMGAGRGRLARTLLAESGWLGVLGGIGGMALAAAGLRLLRALAPAGLPRAGAIGLDLGSVAVAAAASLVAAMVLGWLPLLRLRASRALAALREGGRGGSVGRERHRARNGLVVAQLAMALVLLIGAGLLLRTFWNLRSVDPGFRTERLLLFDLRLPGSDSAAVGAAVDFHQRLLARLEALPGVESATVGIGGLPIEGARAANPVWVEDRPLPPGRLPEPVTVRVVGSGYFETLGIPLIAGRTIDRRDLEARTGVAVVSEGFARREWGEEDPLGKRIRPVPDWPWMPVVGVVADVRQDALHEPAGPAVYVPAIVTGDRFYSTPDEPTYALHTAGEPASVVPAVRRVVHELDPTLPLADVRTMDDVLAGSVARVSFAMTLLAIAAAMGLLLGTVGIYAVTAYVTRLRTREIGVRIALGARAREILSLVLRQGLTVIAAGIGLGLVGAVVLTRALESLLFGVAALDPLTYGGVALLLGGTALAATLLPARRAAAVDPMVALRHE